MQASGRGGARRRWQWLWALWLGASLPGLVWAAAPTHPDQAGTCGPSAIGSPCLEQGPASLQDPTAQPLGLGNPVHVLTGHKYQRDTDARAGPHELDLELVRHYNSADPRDVGLGPGWRLSYDTRVYTAANGYHVVQANGVQWQFGAVAGGRGPCRPATPGQGELDVLAQGGWIWRWPQGRVLQFDAAGRLRQIREPDGRVLQMGWQRLPGRRDADRLAWVRDPTGRELRLEYQQGRLVAAHLPFGTMRYRHARSGELQVALSPSGEGRLYLYAALPTPVAGAPEVSLAVAGHRRLTALLALRRGAVRPWWRWRYDASGRVVRAQRDGGAQPAVVALQYRTGATPMAARQTGLVQGKHTWQLAFQPPVDQAPRVWRMMVTHTVDGAAAAPEATRGVPGWPGFQALPATAAGARAWTSAETGLQRRESLPGPAGPTQRWTFANGGQWWLQYDGAGRLRQWQRRHAGRRDDVHLAYPDAWTVTLEHVTESRRHDRSWLANTPGSVAVAAPDAAYRDTTVATRPALADMAAWAYREVRWHNRAGQLVRHALPEGGELRYRHSAAGRLQGITWHDGAGREVRLYHHDGDRVRLANGLEVRQWRGADGASWMWQGWGARPAVVHARWPDARGLIVREGMRVLGSPPVQRMLHYDTQARVVAVAEPGLQQFRAWHGSGALRAAQDRRMAPEPADEGGALRPVPRDASGLPQDWDGWQLTFGPDRRVAQARRAGAAVHYHYGPTGELLARVVAGVARQYLHAGHQRLAEWRADGRGGSRIARRFVYAGEVPVALLQWPDGTERADDGPEVLTVHADALGQPVALSDGARRVRWQATPDAWGAVRHARGHGDPGWRWPGQWADALVGWHLNHQRIYLPARGQYLEPEPLGPPPVAPALGVPTSVFGYAAQQPRRFLDPSGLVLFAFDGTLHDAQTGGNVYRLASWYRDAQAVAAGLAPAYYQPGPGVTDWLDAAVAHSATAIVQSQWQSLLQHLMALVPGADPVRIDLVGYSRGAALARHFANQVAAQVRQGRFWTWDNQLGAITQCVDLRFLGVFDTVAQFGVLGRDNGAFDFTLDPAWRGVAHAVALHERRAWFPLVSLREGDQDLEPGVLERGFIGAHGDIGGGLRPLADLAPGELPLSEVALAWMAEQAEALGVRLEREAARAGDWAWMHDARTPYQRLQGWMHDAAAGGAAPGVQPSDRAVLAADGTAWLPYQGLADDLGAAIRLSAETVMQRAERWLHDPASPVAQVDLAAYERWLAGLP